MFRRRRIFQANTLTTDQLAVLVRANQLMSEGKPLDAGPLFTNVADALKHSNHPRRAANLYTRAAHAFADGNNEQASLTCAREALVLFSQYEMAGRASAFFTNITNKMKAKGMKAAAEVLQREYGGQIPEQPAGPQRGKPQVHPLMPTNCPKCGAPIHGEDATWVDDNTIECIYCGTLVRAE
jgi:hypothetical protein